MPIFEYRCRECGETIEKIQRLPAEEIACPNCGQPARRVVSVCSSPSGGGGGCSAPAGSGFS